MQQLRIGGRGYVHAPQLAENATNATVGAAAPNEDGEFAMEGHCGMARIRATEGGKVCILGGWGRMYVCSGWQWKMVC